METQVLCTMNAAYNSHEFCLNCFQMLPAYSDVEKLQKLPSILFWFGCKKNIISNSSKMVSLYFTFEVLLYSVVNTQRACGYNVFNDGVQNKSYQMEFFEVDLYILEYMECNDWLCFCQKACFF